MKNKTLKISALILVGASIVYFIAKSMKKNNSAENVVIDDSDLLESDINYDSADGVKPTDKETINIKKYLEFLKKTPSTDSDNDMLIGRDVYSLFDNVNLRNDASMYNDSKVSVIGKKYTYLGKISGLALDSSEKLWLKLTPTTSNPKLVKLFKWGQQKKNPLVRYVKATAVFAKA